MSFVDRTFVHLGASPGSRCRSRWAWPSADSLKTGLTAPALGRRGARADPAPRHLQHQLALPLLRPPRFATGDESRNLLWLALPSLGEAWHNNHHAFPTSAAHGLRRWQLDPSALVIRGLEKLGLAWDVVRISPERQSLKAFAA